MKKTILLASLLGITITANAATKDFHVGVGSSNTMNNGSEMEYKLGYGVENDKSNLLYAGVAFDFGYSKTKDALQKDLTVMTYGGDGKLGVNLGDLAVYGIAGALYQTFGNSVTGYAFGYGAGAEYRFNKSLATAVEYKSYTPKLESGAKYDYTNTNLVLKYTF